MSIISSRLPNTEYDLEEGQKKKKEGFVPLWAM